MEQLSLFEERRNTGLFSQYYLDEILVPEFGKPDGPAPDATLSYFKEKFDILEPIIRENVDTAATRNEAQIEEAVIRPILKNVLGHIYDVQVRQGNDNPDYVLFATDEGKKQSMTLNRSTKEFQDLATGIIDAKSWKKERRQGIGREANISQIFRYLTNFSKRWGILTDGFRWMLFANKTGIRQDQYIEFDLRKIIEDPEGFKGVNFRLFIYLLRREAFDWTPGATALLDDILELSVKNAERLQTNLKTKVYEAFGIVAEEYRRFNNLELNTSEEISELKEASLIFLYRILFLLFGESRLILPVSPKTKPYYALSLQSLIEDQIDRNRALPNRTLYWTALNELFSLIHGLEKDGSPSRLGKDIGLPAYNGGLFDPDKYPKIVEWKLGDEAIKRVMDLLSKTGEKQKNKVYGSDSREVKQVSVSYRDLGVQHLGNIYEGILENHVVVEDGVVKIQNDKKERRATGSYYTPDYIVDYIVEETIGPLVKQARKSENNAEGILGIKVVDPAMGSGHFLVGAIDFLAKELAEVTHEEGIYTEAELSECRRQIAERCIYGVDLNPMAVELAKLSIWLHTISREKPLTFLDNHIKCGNALIGARLSDLSALPLKQKRKVDTKDQGLLFPLNKLEQEVPLWLAEGRLFKEASDDIESVKKKEHLEKVLSERRVKWKHLADLRTASYFLDVEDVNLSSLFRKLSDAIVVNADEAPRPQSKLLDQALSISKEKRFFHWELEFPEIFFDKFGRRDEPTSGFDAVIGNPPYGAQLTEADRYALSHLLPEVAIGNMDTYKFFMQEALNLGMAQARCGFILSDSFIEKEYFSDLRISVSNSSTELRTVRLGEYVFVEVQLPSALWLFKKGDSGNIVTEYVDISALRTNDLRSVALREPLPFLRDVPDFKRTLVPDPVNSHNVKVTALIEVFDEVMGVKVYQRGKGRPPQSDDERLTDKFISKTPREGWHPFLSEGIYRYEHHWNGEYIYYGPWLAEPRELKFFESAKIVMREVVNPRPFATYVEELCVVKNTAAVFIKRPNDYSLLFLLAILNSKYFKKKIFELSAKRNNQSYPSFTSKLLKNLPIPVISFDHSRPHQYHDQLASLAQQMLEMHKTKQAHVTDFFIWMGNYGIPSRDEIRKDKSALDEFWTLKFEDVLAHLRKNKVRIDTQVQGDLFTRFSEAKKNILALESKIAATDDQIDEIVYQLYGLTEDEIAIVKRS